MTDLTSLHDRFMRPLKDLRISVTDRCNFRCPYCMPAEVYGERYQYLPKPDILTFEEIERLARIFVSLGARKLRLTGGEPLVRAEFPNLVKRLAAIPEIDDLAMTTNGYLLSKLAIQLRESGLRRVTVSLDSLDEQVFQRMNGRGYGTKKVLEGIEAAKHAGLLPIKINCVVQRGVNEHTLVDLARRFQNTGIIIRFIEYMDVGNLNGWDWSQVVSAQEIIERINAHLPLEPANAIYHGETAIRYRYRDGSGEIGIIASVSQPFCGDCNRARLTTDGKLVTCLFAQGGLDLRGPLRAGASIADLAALVRNAWIRRVDRYSEERATGRSKGAAHSFERKIEMYQIGG
jgi:GTP 3',8-cyclase